MSSPQPRLEYIADFAEKSKRRRYTQVDYETEDNCYLGIDGLGMSRVLIQGRQNWYCLGIGVETANEYGLYEAAVVPQMGSVRVADP